MRILITNPPWYQAPAEGVRGYRGVRAGSRWPHTHPLPTFTPKDGFAPELTHGYVPFPVELTTAAEHVRRAGFEVACRDSLSMGETKEHYYEYVAEYQPDIILLESSTPTIQLDLKIIHKLRGLVPKAKVVVCGIHFEIEKEEFLAANPEVDYTIYGEYEDSFLKLVRALDQGTDLAAVPALLYREGNSILKTKFADLPELAEYPWPDRTELPNEHYYDGVCGLQGPQLQLMGTRGCPFGCIFCAWPQIVYRGKKWRTRTADDIVAEIQHNLKQVPYKSFYLDDDTFNIKKSFVMELAAAIKKAGLDQMQWSTMGRGDLMDEDMLQALKGAGLFSIKYGVESADQGILDEIDKGTNLEKNLKWIRRTEELGIRVHLTYTFGLPSDTVETIEKTIELACSLPVHTVQFSVATPYPGTKMYDMYEAKGWLRTKNWEEYNGSCSAVSRTERFTSEQLEDFVKLAYRRFAESRIVSVEGSQGFPSAQRRLAELVQPGARILLTQSANVLLTSRLARVIGQWGYEVHIFTPERFAPEFETVLPSERVHCFGGGTHFKADRLAEQARQLHRDYGFKGAIVPYSMRDPEGYEEVHQVAEAAGGGILFGINIEGSVLECAHQ
jgi:radical SAM superfamily enzyme YgiQ (UPF0313 family)